MKLLVCGTRNAKYHPVQVLKHIDELSPNTIIEGCCPDSADIIAEKYDKAEREIKHEHYPSSSGNYLRRNIEMVNACDQVLAFWDGWSYGTAHTIAQAVMKGKPITIVQVDK